MRGSLGRLAEVEMEQKGCARRGKGTRKKGRGR